MGSRLLFVSNREKIVRFAVALAFVPVPLTAALLSLAPISEWEQIFGESLWWVVPASLMLLSLAMPAAALWLHGRYVLRCEEENGTLRWTVFLLWGRRAEAVDTAQLASAKFTSIAAGTRLRSRDAVIDLVFDDGGVFPEGEEAISDLAGASPER